MVVVEEVSVVVALESYEIATDGAVPFTSPVCPPSSIQVPSIWRLVKEKSAVPATTTPWKFPAIVTVMPAALTPLAVNWATITSPSTGVV